MIILLKGLCTIVCLQPQSTGLSDSGGAFQSFAAVLLIERKAVGSLSSTFIIHKSLGDLTGFLGAQGSWDTKILFGISNSYISVSRFFQK